MFNIYICPLVLNFRNYKCCSVCATQVGTAYLINNYKPLRACLGHRKWYISTVFL